MKRYWLTIFTLAATASALGNDPYALVSEAEKKILLSSCLTTAPGQGSGLWTSDVSMKWPQRSVVTVSFLDGTRAWQDTVLRIASEWTSYTGISFARAEKAGNIRVTFKVPVYQSMIGKQALVRRDPTLSTMKLGFPIGASNLVVRRVVLHEFGHALGFAHEHQSPSATIRWKKEEVFKFYANRKPPWSKEEVLKNILRKFDASARSDATAQSRIAASVFDRDSIMIYPIPAELTEDGFSVDWNTELSKRDKEFAQQQYQHNPQKPVR